MTKKEIAKRILLKNGNPISLDDFIYYPYTKTISTKLNNLVFNFNNINNFNFFTGSNCTFKTRSDCTFNTGYSCTFDTSFNCTFDTGSDCTFKTEFNCTFNTNSFCTFNTSFDCTFDTGSDCVFNTGSKCIFKTGSNCMFKTSSDCIFDTKYNCVCIRIDIYEVIELPSNKTIKLNKVNIKGYNVINNITTNSSSIEITVKINGKEAKLNDISKDTLMKLREIN